MKPLFVSSLNRQKGLDNTNFMNVCLACRTWPLVEREPDENGITLLYILEWGGVRWEAPTTRQEQISVRTATRIIIFHTVSFFFPGTNKSICLSDLNHIHSWESFNHVVIATKLTEGFSSHLLCHYCEIWSTCVNITAHFPFTFIRTMLEELTLPRKYLFKQSEVSKLLTFQNEATLAHVCAHCLA